MATCVCVFVQLGGETGVGNPQTARLKNVFRLMPIILIPITASFPAVRTVAVDPTINGYSKERDTCFDPLVLLRPLILLNWRFHSIPPLTYFIVEVSA